jgi:Domain of unknown function DUF11
MQSTFGRMVVALSVFVPILLAGPVEAAANPPPPSSVQVSSTTVRPGDTLTIVEQVYNPLTFDVTGAKPTIEAKEVAFSAVADLVDCAVVVFPCYEYLGAYRAQVGDLPPGESRAATFTLRIRGDAPLGAFTLRHALVGENYGFVEFDGPVITVLPGAGDLAVSLDAAPGGVQTATVNHTVTVRNIGPAGVTAIRMVATYPSGLRFLQSTGCTHPANTNQVVCDFASLPAGGTATARFLLTSDQLAPGPVTTTITRQASAPGDRNPANDAGTVTCVAVTNQLLRC